MDIAHIEVVNYHAGVIILANQMKKYITVNQFLDLYGARNRRELFDLLFGLNLIEALSYYDDRETIPKNIRWKGVYR